MKEVTEAITKQTINEVAEVGSGNIMVEIPKEDVKKATREMT